MSLGAYLNKISTEETVRLENKGKQREQSHVYDDPLSINATALLLGAPETFVDGTTTLVLTITASIKTFHR